MFKQKRNTFVLKGFNNFHSFLLLTATKLRKFSWLTVWPGLGEKNDFSKNFRSFMGHKDHFHSCILTKLCNKFSLFIWVVWYFENSLHSDVAGRFIPFAGVGRQHDKKWVFHISDPARLSRHAGRTQVSECKGGRRQEWESVLTAPNSLPCSRDHASLLNSLP